MAGLTVAAALVAIVIFGIVYIIRPRQGSKTLPPGPPLWPLVGENCAWSTSNDERDTNYHRARQLTTDPDIESISQVSGNHGSIRRKGMTENPGRFTEWAHTYGPIFALKLGPQDLVILNTASAVHE